MNRTLMLHIILLVFLNFSLVNSLDFHVISYGFDKSSFYSKNALCILFASRIGNHSLSSLVQDPARRMFALDMLKNKKTLCEASKQFPPLIEMFNPNSELFDKKINNFFKKTKKSFRDALIDNLPIIEAVPALLKLKAKDAAFFKAFTQCNAQELHELVANSFTIKLQVERIIHKNISMLLQDQRLTENQRNTFWFTDGRKQLEHDLLKAFFSEFPKEKNIIKTEEAYQHYLKHTYEEKYLYSETKIARKKKSNHVVPSKLNPRGKMVQAFYEMNLSSEDRIFFMDHLFDFEPKKHPAYLFENIQRDSWAHAESYVSICEFRMVHNKPIDDIFEKINPAEFFHYLKNNSARLAHIIRAYTHFLHTYGIDLTPAFDISSNNIN